MTSPTPAPGRPVTTGRNEARANTDNTGFGLHPARRLFPCCGRRAAARSRRCLRRPRPRARIIHKHTESHQLLHDLLLHHRRYPWGGRRRWTSSIRVASTWVCGRKCTKPWADSRGCASGRTSTSASESSREDIRAGCSPVPGYTTSDGQTSENSSSRYTIPGLPASICTRSIRNR